MFARSRRSERGTLPRRAARGSALRTSPRRSPRYPNSATLLVREEIELAKAEVTEKVSKLASGAVVGVAAGVFVSMALVFALDRLRVAALLVLPGNDFTLLLGFLRDGR